MPDWLIVADDLTGACDSGAAFAGRGYRTRVALRGEYEFDTAQVAVLVTESRAMPSAAQAMATASAALRMAGQEGPQVYHKIDSTLRGYPGEEFAALLAATGCARALVCPAFPEQGRVVRAGRVLVHGVPLAETAFAGAMAAAPLEQRFAAGPGSRPLRLAEIRRGDDWLARRLAEPGVHTADAETPSDLAALARAGQKAGLRLYCGSAGLARALAAQMALRQGQRALPRAQGPMLAIAGSRSPATLGQVRALADQGWEVVYPQASDLEENAAGSPLVLRIATILSQGKPVALGVERLAALAGGEVRVAEWLAELAAAVMQRSPAGGLILTGGATARAVLLALGCVAIELRGEVEPGIVRGILLGGRWDGLPLVTKAGGFGGADALVKAGELK